MLCSYCLINNSSGYLHITVYLAVMLQASWHTVEINYESEGRSIYQVMMDTQTLQHEPWLI